MSREFISRLVAWSSQLIDAGRVWNGSSSGYNLMFRRCGLVVRRVSCMRVFRAYKRALGNDTIMCAVQERDEGVGQAVTAARSRVLDLMGSFPIT